MESDILNVGDRGVTPGFGCGEANRVESELAADEKRGAGGITIYVPTGVCEFAGATVETSTAASAYGQQFHFHGEGSATFVQSFSSTLVVLTDVRDNRSSGETLLEGLAFQGAFQPAA